MRYVDGFVFFWGDWPSNWYKSPFVVDGVSYNCGEQWMMACKARMFGDDDVLARIMATPNPRSQKALGRTVRNFDDATWKATARDVVYVGLLAKFDQNPVLRAHLLATGTDMLVEASPHDTLWGIGLDMNHPDVTNPEKWRGQNWLGDVLMAVRNTLRQRDTKRLTQGTHLGV